MARFGTLLVVLGLLIVAFGALWQVGVVPGSRVTLPEPVALRSATAGSREVSAAVQPVPTLSALPTAVPTLPSAEVVPVATPTSQVVALPTQPAFVVPLAAADAADRAEASRLPASVGYAVRLAIPSIKLDTVVAQAGIVQDANGEPVWETLPFVAVHYGDLTALIGAPGNAVIAGHVVTLKEGNVFRLLYQVDIGDQIDVWDELTREHDFQVVGVKLVPPSDTSVMDPTTDETLTLITCGGTFDPVKREFSDRLIVTAKPL